MNLKFQVRYPIFIPSKGRAQRLLTARCLDRDGVPYKVVVEPSQAEAYAATVGWNRLEILPENNRGLVYSRNWITDHARSLYVERHWQIDDDILYFVCWRRGTEIQCRADYALAASEDFADRYENVGLLSLNSCFFVRPSIQYQKVPPFYLNHRCYTIILFLNSLPYRWRPPNNEDADMTLQVLAGGWCTVLLNALAMKTLTTMKHKGGQTESFKAGARLAMVRALERRWPGVVTVGRRFGHPQHFVKGDWEFFDNKLKLKQGTNKLELAGKRWDAKLVQVGDLRSSNLRRLFAEDLNA
jgi:hypothetical protein